MQATVAAPMTAEQLLRTPDDGVRRELLWGDLHEMTPTSWRHGVVTALLTMLLGDYVRRNRNGLIFGAETGFVLARDPDLVRAPDVAFVAAERLPAEDSVGFCDGAPDLAVEVMSPSDPFTYVEEKAQCWLRHGTREVWLVDPGTRRVQVRHAEGQVHDLGPEEAIESDLFPGFELSVAAVFEL